MLIQTGASGSASDFDATLIANSAIFDGSADYLTRTPGSAGNRTRWTIAWWFRLNAVSTEMVFFSANSSTNEFRIGLEAAGQMMVQDDNASMNMQTAMLFRDIAWYHCIVSYDSNQAEADRVKVYVNGVEQTLNAVSAGTPSSAGETFWNNNQANEIGRRSRTTSVYTNAYMSQILFLDGDSIQNSDVAVSDILDTASFGSNGSQRIPKTGLESLATAAGGTSFYLDFTNGAPTKIDDSGSTKSGNMTANGGLAAIFDGDTSKNNSEVGSGANTSSNDSFVVVDHGSAKTVTKFIAYGSSDAEGLDGDSGGSTLTFTLAGSTDNFSSSNVSLFSGTVSDPGAGGTHTVSSGITAGSYRYHKMTLQTNTTNAGEQFGQFAELEYYEGNGLGTDLSDNGNHFVVNSMGSDNQSTNTPSLVYPTVNPVTKIGSASSTLEEGNTKATVNDNGGIVISQVLPFYDLWYFEINVTTNSAWYPGIGQQSAIGYNSTAAWNNTTAETHVWLSDHSGNYFNNNGSLSTYPIASSTTGRFAVAWDGDNRALYFGTISGSTITWINSGDPTSGSSKTGAAPGNWPTSGTGPLYFIVIGGGTSVMEFDFPSGDWTGSTNRPADAKELNTANLTSPTHFGCDYFTPVKYTGNGTAIGSGGKAVTGANLQPDFVWIKNRDASDSNALYDVVRGTTKQAETDTTAIETTEAEGLSVFGSDGFTLGSLAEVNTSSEDFISWNFKAGGSASSNGSGSITSSVSAAAPGHFSIVSWTGNTTAGATVGHGLGGAPEFIIAIARNESGENKPVYHKFMTADTDHLKINENNAQGTAGTTIWDESAMSSTVIGLGAAAQSNSTNGMIAYCFRSISGVCKVASYVGNGSATAPPYVAVGFRPRWIMVKNISVARDWVVVDTARTPINPAELFLFPNEANAEAANGPASGSTYDFDILADGFRPLTGDSAPNGSGNTILYAAFSDIAGNGSALPPIYGR